MKPMPFASFSYGRSRRGPFSADHEQITRKVLDRFEQQVGAELRQLEDTIGGLRAQPGIEVYSLNDRMLRKSIHLAEIDLGLEPFDQAILAAVLSRAEELRQEGETDFCFCETDAYLQPWDKRGDAKRPLTNLYDFAGIWVFGDFSLTWPERPQDWS
jgi:hypothetical protein